MPMGSSQIPIEEVQRMALKGDTIDLSKYPEVMKELSAAIEDANAKLKQTKSETKAINKTALNTVAKFGAIAAAAYKIQRAVARVRDAVVDLGRESSNLAIRFVEQEQRMQNMFRTGGARRMAKTLVGEVRGAFELSNIEAQRLVSSVADLSTSMHFTEESSLKMSAAIIMLAGDLTSFQDREEGIQGTAERLTKSLIGNRRALKDLSISVNENDQRFKSLKKAFMQGVDEGNNLNIVLKHARKENKELFKSMFKTERLSMTQAKAMATLVMSYEQSQHALTDYSRTHTSAANQIRAFRAALEDMKTSLGRTLLVTLKLDKVFKSLTQLVRVTTKIWDEMSDGMKTTIVVGTIILVVLASIAAAILGVIVAVGAIAAAVSVLGISLGTLVAIIGGVILGLVALVAQFLVALALIGNGEGVLADIADGFNILTTWILMAIGFVLNLKKNWQLAMDSMSIYIGEFYSQVKWQLTDLYLTIGNFVKRIMNAKDALEALARTGDKGFAMRVLEMGTTDPALAMKKYNEEMKRYAEMRKNLGVEKGFQFDFTIGGEIPSMKALMDKFGKFKSGTDVGELVKNPPTAVVEGSSAASNIIASIVSGSNDPQSRTAAATEQTAAAANAIAGLVAGISGQGVNIKNAAPA